MNEYSCTLVEIEYDVMEKGEHEFDYILGFCINCGLKMDNLCEHPNAYPVKQAEDCFNYRNNGNGTHNADVYITYSLYCPECGHSVPASDYYETEYGVTMLHEWEENEGYTYCACGAENICDHEYTEEYTVYNYDWPNSGLPATPADGGHVSTGTVWYTVYSRCQDCGKTTWLSEGQSGEGTFAPHSFYVANDEGTLFECEYCGYECEHNNLENAHNTYIITERVSLNEEGHVLMVRDGMSGYCADCGYEATVPTSDEVYQLTEGHIPDENGICTVCRWKLAEEEGCEHD